MEKNVHQTVEINSRIVPIFEEFSYMTQHREEWGGSVPGSSDDLGFEGLPDVCQMDENLQENLDYRDCGRCR